MHSQKIDPHGDGGRQKEGQEAIGGSRRAEEDREESGWVNNTTALA